MKLVRKTQRMYLILAIALLLVWSIVFLFAIAWAIEENVDETLQSELMEMVNEAKRSNSIQTVSMQQMEIRPIAVALDTTISFSDTTLYNLVEQETFPYRQASTQLRAAGQAYEITLRRSMVEYDDLFEAILVMELLLVLLLLGGLFFINKKILQRLWHPFYDTLQQITDYKIGRRSEIKWEETKINEFRQLNEVLQDMIRHIEREYLSLKQFTENASHELQTPLSVISSKVEILLQDESLTCEQGQNLNTIHQTIGKISRLNRALLMLTKIENEQFNKTEEVDLSSLLENLIPDYRTLAESRDITIYEHLKPGIPVKMNAELAELIVRNLMGNAIKHNVEGGYVKIRLDNRYFTIKNTGTVPADEPQIYFERFRKDKHSMDSLGLGLSIVAAIAKANNLDLKYIVKKDLHILSVNFD